MTTTLERARPVRLARRGVLHGSFTPTRPAPFDPRDTAQLAEYERLWAEDRLIQLPGIAAPGVARFRREAQASVAMFERLRAGAKFEDELALRLDASCDFAPAGVTVDLGDTREIEKVFANAVRGRRTLARDLYAKLSWVAHVDNNVSLRIRFSFGAEALRDWQKETRRAPWSDRFAAEVFPECAAITENRALVGLIERLTGRRVRFSERIVYNNAPGGGAAFHHDDEMFQLGVVFTQLAGETGWFGLPKRELAELVSAHARGALRKRAGTPRKALRALDDTSDPLLAKLLDSTPSFTRELAERGLFFHMRPGDSLLMPAHGPDDVCWHAVYGLPPRASLAHSYGIFARKRGAE